MKGAPTSGRGTQAITAKKYSPRWLRCDTENITAVILGRCVNFMIGQFQDLRFYPGYSACSC
jgi:hypothetical protein